MASCNLLLLLVLLWLLFIRFLNLGQGRCDQIGRFFLTLGNFLGPFATINLAKSSTFLGNFCKGVKIYHFSSEIIFGQLL